MHTQQPHVDLYRLDSEVVPEAGPHSSSSGKIARQAARKQRRHFVSVRLGRQLSGPHASSTEALYLRTLGASEAEHSLLHAHGSLQHICNKPWFHCTTRQAAAAAAAVLAAAPYLLLRTRKSARPTLTAAAGKTLEQRRPQGGAADMAVAGTAGLPPMPSTDVRRRPTGACTQRDLMSQP